MNRIRLLCSAGCLLVPLPGLSQAVPKESPGLTSADYEGWSVFADARVGFQLPVPPGTKAVKDVAPGRFTSEDGAWVLAVWGGVSATPARIMDWQWSQARAVAGRTCSVQRKDAAGFVISATDRSGAKFFQKFIIRGDR
ncbi:MAG TPA: hypothetical protein VHM91_08115, partial [Verrucomicrobiales bacterium]|nr:hypothetical protein [Verrucomicrobiales bacterium]